MVYAMKPKNIEFGPAWKQLKETAEDVMHGSVDRKIWFDRYWDVYNLCVSTPEPYGDRLYKETKDYLDCHVKYLHGLVVNGQDLLESYFSHWIRYSQGVDCLNKLYLYLNMHYIRKFRATEADLNYGQSEPSNDLLEIGELGLSIWRINMIDPLCDRLVTLLLDAILRDRLGDPPNQRVVHGVIQSFVQCEEFKRRAALEFYQQAFEVPFIKATSDYYQVKAEELLKKCDCSAYMRAVSQLLEAEELRCLMFLHSSSLPKVRRVCEDKMIALHLSFLHAECPRLVVAEDKKDLENMYTLLKPVQGALAVLVKEVQTRIEKVGMALVENRATGDNMPQAFVESVLEVYHKYKALIQEVFHSDQSFVCALDKACTTIINHRPAQRQPCRSPELLAKYCDTLLKRSAKGLTESEIEERLSQSIIVFKYIEDKDVYQKFYAKMLAKRLIHAQSTSMDAEEAMINRLKQACGYEFTSKLHRMFTDMSVSSDLNNKFSEHLAQENVDLGINFNIYVLQAGAWPLMQGPNCTFAIPKELERSIQMFETFYNKKFSGRKLTWLQHLCSAEVRLNYLNKPYHVTMSTFQMALMLLFENCDTLSYAELQESSRLNDDQLQRQLQSLIEAKFLGGPAEHTQDSRYLLNLEYNNKRTKFKINPAPMKEVTQQAQQESEHTRNSVEEDRKLFLQAAIVRIMKARKVLKHNTLIQEVINQSNSRFVPSVSMIKKCVEALIDKAYLERMPNTTDEYSYVA